MSHTSHAAFAHVQVPATSANMGPGFDSFGLALALYNRFCVRHSEADILIADPGSSMDLTAVLQTPSASSLLIQTAAYFYSQLGNPRPPLHIAIEAHVPPARGLGSSASAVVGMLVALNALENTPFTCEQLGHFANAIEGHPDNVLPALYGGVLLSDDTDPAHILHRSLPWPRDWHILVGIPQYPVSTHKARQALPEAYPLKDVVFTLRKASLLTYALLQGDAEAFMTSLEDRVHQPYRQPFIAEFEAVSHLARTHGAFGTVISGSGPTIAVFYPASAEMLPVTCQEAFPALQWHALTVDTAGATLL